MSYEQIWIIGAMFTFGFMHVLRDSGSTGGMLIGLVLCVVAWPWLLGCELANKLDR